MTNLEHREQSEPRRAEQFRRWRSLQGRQVSIAVTDGSCIEDCQLISAGVPGTGNLWVFSNGADVFIPVERVREVWERAA